MDFIVFLFLTVIFFCVVFLSFFVLGFVFRAKKPSIWFWIWVSLLFHSLFLLDWQKFLDSQAINLSPLATISNKTLLTQKTGLKRPRPQSLVFLMPENSLKKQQGYHPVHTETTQSPKKEVSKKDSPNIETGKNSFKNEQQSINPSETTLKKQEYSLKNEPKTQENKSSKPNSNFLSALNSEKLSIQSNSSVSKAKSGEAKKLNSILQKEEPQSINPSETTLKRQEYSLKNKPKNQENKSSKPNSNFLSTLNSKKPSIHSNSSVSKAKSGEVKKLKSILQKEEPQSINPTEIPLKKQEYSLKNKPKNQENKSSKPNSNFLSTLTSEKPSIQSNSSVSKAKSGEVKKLKSILQKEEPQSINPSEIPLKRQEYSLKNELKTQENKSSKPNSNFLSNLPSEKPSIQSNSSVSEAKSSEAKKLKSILQKEEPQSSNPTEVPLKRQEYSLKNEKKLTQSPPTNQQKSKLETKEAKQPEILNPTESLPNWLRKKLNNQLETFKWIQANQDLYFKENWKRFQVNLSLENQDQEMGFSLEGLKNFNHRSYLQDITMKIGDLWFWKYLPLEQIAHGLVRAEKEIIVDFEIDSQGQIQEFSFLKRGIMDIQNQAIEKTFQSVQLEKAPTGYQYRSLQMTFKVLGPKPNFSGGVQIQGNILLEGEVQFPQTH